MAAYSSTPLVKKLGIRAGFRLYIYDPPSEYFDWIHPLPADVSVLQKLSSPPDMIHLFVRDIKTFERMLVSAQKFQKKDGMIWVSWPKKSSGIASGLNENIIRDFALAHGLVDIKVCAVDAVWSGLKLVIPLKDR